MAPCKKGIMKRSEAEEKIKKIIERVTQGEGLKTEDFKKELEELLWRLVSKRYTLID
ncbi:MAG: hypothetical protein Q7R73_03905 [bacterium]|nr:hypothetical protein [bacterium]